MSEFFVIRGSKLSAGVYSVFRCMGVCVCGGGGGGRGVSLIIIACKVLKKNVLPVVQNMQFMRKENVIW